MKTWTRRLTLSSVTLLLAALPHLQAEKPKPIETDFEVLNSEASTTEIQRNCDKGDGGGGALGGLLDGLGQSLCESTRSRTSHLAAIVDADHVHGYVVECEERKGRLAPKCIPLVAGQRLRGYLQNGKLLLEVEGKTITYSILKSMYYPAPAKKSNGETGTVL